MHTWKKLWNYTLLTERSKYSSNGVFFTLCFNETIIENTDSDTNSKKIIAIIYFWPQYSIYGCHAGIVISVSKLLGRPSD